MDKVARWNISDREALRARELNIGERELSDLIDITGLGPSAILKVLEKAMSLGYIQPKGKELRMVEMFIRTQLPDNVLDVLEEIDNMK